MVSSEMPTKDILRSSIMTLLNETKTIESCNTAGMDIASRLRSLPAYRRAAKVSSFISRFPEIDSVPLIDSQYGDSKQVYIPTWFNGDMNMVAMSDKEHFHRLLSARKSVTHIPRPPFDPATPIDEMDLCIIPGLVFDRFGGRIGYGLGHYDKYLTEHLSKHGRIPYLIAVCHDEQMVDTEIPIEEHDVRVNMVVTPTKTFTTLNCFANNPRTHKSALAAKYAGVEITENVIEMAQTKAADYLAKFPFGKAPTMDTKEGGLFESSAIAYYVAAHKEELVGKTPFEKASVLQWLFFADVEFFATFSQWLYPILGYSTSDKAAHTKTVAPIEKILAALDAALAKRTYLVGESITLADLVLTSVMVPAFKLFLTASNRMNLVNLTRWFVTMANQPEVKAVLGEVALCEERATYTPAVAAPKAEAKPAAPVAAAAGNEEEEVAAPKPKAKASFDSLPPTTFNLEDWKRFYSNNDTRPTAIDYFWKNFDPAGFTIWRIDYKYNDELARIFMTCNLITGFFSRMDNLRKYLFGSVLIFGEDNANEISGYLVLRGTEMPPEMIDVPDYESFDFRRVDINDAKERALFEDYLAWDGELAGKKFVEGKTFK